MADNKDKKVLNVPALRFPEFTNEWIFAPLYDYLEVNRERNRNDEFDKGAVLSVSGDYGIVNQIQLLGRSFAGSSVKDYHVVRKGNIVYTKSPLKEYPYGIVKVNKGNEGIVSTLYAVYNVKHNAVGGFIESYFALPKRTNRYFKPIVRIGAKHDMKIGNEEAIANIVCFPSHAEQRKIAAFLSLLDQRISIQNKIIEDLKKLKSAIVEALFCAPRESMPAKRLSPYSKEWKFVKLSDICQRIQTKNIGRQCRQVLTIAAQYGLVNQEDFFNKTVASENLEGYYLLQKGDFAYNKSYSGDYAWGAIKRLERYEQGVLSPLYICFRPDTAKVDADYLTHYFESKKWHKGIADIAGEGARNHGLLNISVIDFFNTIHRIPDLDEQKNIAQIINSLSSKLSCEQHIMQSLTMQRNYLLHKMFI